MKKALPYLIIIVALALFIISYLPSITSRNQKLTYETPTFTAPTSTPLTSTDVSTTTRKIDPSVPKSEILKATSTPAAITVTLSVRSQAYVTVVPQGSTVWNTMNYLASSTPFRFHAVYYPGMDGYFVDEINGVKSKTDAFWIYYVNNSEPSIGISQYTLKSGDSIQWKLEDSNGHEVL